MRAGFLGLSVGQVGGNAERERACSRYLFEQAAREHVKLKRGRSSCWSYLSSKVFFFFAKNSSK